MLDTLTRDRAKGVTSSTPSATIWSRTGCRLQRHRAADHELAAQPRKSSRKAPRRQPGVREPRLGVGQGRLADSMERPPSDPGDSLWSDFATVRAKVHA